MTDDNAKNESRERRPSKRRRRRRPRRRKPSQNTPPIDVQGFLWRKNQGQAMLVQAEDNFVADRSSPAVPENLLKPLHLESGLYIEGVAFSGDRPRLKEITKVEKEIAKSEAKLGNANFVERAKPEVVEQERARLAEWREKLGQLAEMRDALA